MFGWVHRLLPESSLPTVRSDPPIGIGAMVIVLSDPGSADAWEGTPTGVVIATGERELVGYPNHRSGGSGSWLIAFDAPAYRADGRGPVERASVPVRLLVPAPLVEEWVLER